MRLVKNNNLKELSLQITLCTASLVILADQLIKNKIRSSGGFYFCNEGISFGFQPPILLFWLCFGLFLSFSFFYYLKILPKKKFHSSLSLGLGFFWGGILANSLDRFFFGCVFDYLSIFGPKYPLFNFADIFISLGGLCLFIYFFSKQNKFIPV